MESEARIEMDAETEMELSYIDLLNTLAMNEEIVITLPLEAENQLRTGLKNMKAKLAAKTKIEGNEVADETLEFYSLPSKEWEDCVRLRIILRKRGSVKVRKIEFPESLP